MTMAPHEDAARAAVAAWRQVPEVEERHRAEQAQQRWDRLRKRQRRGWWLLLVLALLGVGLGVLAGLLGGHSDHAADGPRPAIWQDVFAGVLLAAGMALIALSAVGTLRRGDVLSWRSRLLSPSEQRLVRRQIRGVARYQPSQVPLLRLAAHGLRQGRRQQVAGLVGLAAVQAAAVMAELGSARVVFNLALTILFIGLAVTVARRADPARGVLRLHPTVEGVVGSSPGHEDPERGGHC